LIFCTARLNVVSSETTALKKFNIELNMKSHKGNCLVLLTALGMSLYSCQQTSPTEPVDPAEIVQMMQEYREAWRNGDSTLVMDKLSEDIILYRPDKSGKPIASKDEVAQFWFPASDISYPILSYEVEHEQIEGSGNLAAGSRVN
jgi:hypothetical protein